MVAEILRACAEYPLFLFCSEIDPASALNMERLLEERLCSAVDLRRSLGFPSTNTNAYRLINSEGDRYIPFSRLLYFS